MKKYLITTLLLGLIIACSNNSNKNSNSDSTASASSTNDVTANPDYQKGLQLIAANDCLVCHKIDEKLTGPAYRDVANKYAGVDTAVTYLAHRIINGVGSNDKHNWGEQTNNAIMTPHPALSEADAEQMVKYVLLLKNK